MTARSPGKPRTTPNPEASSLFSVSLAGVISAVVSSPVVSSGVSVTFSSGVSVYRTG
ncbi:hypothetical protein ACSAZL_07465 [Methanosarcina sp. T3]|uniref:hypothetical protein n=1 Tax=Methanosarcina sp. T3 TaxID=3439062 RepID=UPI003F840412